jgi:hypothetical protein
MKIKIWKNEFGSWIREEKHGWLIFAMAFKTKKEAMNTRLIF